MQIKKRYFVIALVLLLGLTTFSFANPKEEMGSRKTAKGISETVTNDKKENNSYSEALEAVEEAEENPTEETVETARNEIRNANDATEEQVQNLQQRVDVVEETIDVAALVKEVEVLAEVKETREQAKSKYPNAETEVNKLDEGEVKNNLENRLAKVSRLLNDTKAPEVTGVDENVPTNKNEIIYVKDEFLASVIIDETEYTDFIVEDDILKFEKKVTTEGTHTVTAKDKLGNTTTKTFIIDKTEAKKNAVNANVNGYDNKVNEQYATNGKKVTAYITLTEELRDKPTFTFYANGKEIKKVKDDVVASASTNANYPYKYTAVLEINEELAAEDGELTYTVTNMYDVAGNQTPDITKLSVIGKVLKLDRTPNRVTFTTISTDNETVEGKVYYVTEGDTITFRMGVREKFSVNPTITIGGKEVTLEYVKYFPSPNHHEYRGTIKLDDTFKDGNLNIIIAGSKDIAGNNGFYYQTNGKKVLETITTKETTNGKSLVYDNNAPKNNYVAILSKAGNYKYAKNGDTIRFLVSFNEEVKLSDDFTITFNGKTKKLSRSGDKTQWEYIAEFTIPKDEKTLLEGSLTFEVKGFQDKLGNASTQILTVANHHKYNGVVYDRTAPGFVEEAGYNENGINPYIKLADKNDISFKVYRKGTETPIHEFDSTTAGKSFKIGWHGGGVYTIVATDAAGNETSKEFEVYHEIDSLEDLKKAFENGGHATLSKEVTITEPIVIPEGVELVIDLKDNELMVEPTNGEQLIINKGKLTIKNGIINNDNAAAGVLIENTKTGELVLEDITTVDKATANGAIISNDGKLTITDSNLKLNEKYIGRNVITNRGDLNISGTKITSQATKGYAITMYEGNLKIDDSNLDILSEGRGGIWIVGGKLTIDNAKINVAAGGTSYRTLYISDHEDGKDIDVTINGGEFTGYRDGIYVGHYDNFDIKLTINGGLFDINPGKNGNILNVDKAKENPEHKLNIAIKGGTYKNKNRGKVDTYIAEGYRLNSENKVVKENAISTQAEMVKAIEDGGKFELDTNLTLTDEPLVIKKGKEVEIDLNGKTITGRSTNASASKLITVNEGATLKLTGKGTIDFTAGKPDTNWGGEGQLPFPGYSSNTISNIGKLIIDGPTLINNTARGGASYVIDNYQGSELIVKSGKIHQTGGDQALRIFANSNTLTTSLTVEGGEIIGRRALWIQLPNSDATRAPKVNVNIKNGILRSNDTGEDGYNIAIYSYSYGESFKNVNVNISGGEFFGHVAFGGGSKNGQETVNVTGGVFHNDLGRYLANDGWEDIAKPAQ